MSILRMFLQWLLVQHPDTSQSEIARRAGLSQSVVNKILVQTGNREPDPETYRALASTYEPDWTQFLREHPSASRELWSLYGWALAAEPTWRRASGGEVFRTTSARRAPASPASTTVRR